MLTRNILSIATAASLLLAPPTIHAAEDVKITARPVF
jgi:hypothetical protein